MIAILCKFCGEHIEVRAWNEHLSSEKHRKNLPSKVVVAGKFESSKIDEVHEYFAKFGKIKTKQVLSNTGEFITLIKYCYEDPMAYSIIAQKQHLFGGQELKINWCKMNDSEYCTLITKIKDTLREKTQSFAQQIETVQEIFQSNSKIATSSEQIFNDVTTLLTTVYPGSKLHFFGSEALNLNLPDSDLNFYIDNVKLTTSIEQSSLRLLQTVISRSEKFENIFLITRQFPRIECRHIESQIKCLISIHKSVIRGTEMIKCYLNLDPKIRSLMFVIKFWARYHRLTESDGFSNHVLYLLVIFYLQQEPYKLPAIVNLLDVENGWRCSSNHAEFVNLENSTIFELVSGFFRFYETFDYVSYVVAPFCGLALEKTSFLEPYLLPTCYNEYVDQKKTLDVDCGLCVQDPFNHSSNLLSGTSLNSGGDFTSQCRKSLITGDCPYLTTMLRVSNNQHFTINKLEGFTDDEWISSVRRVTSTILDTICGCQVKTVKIRANHYLYTCNGNFENFWKDRISVLKKLLLELSIGATEICKEIDVTTNFIKAGTEQKENTKKCSLIIEAKFEKSPSRVQFCFKKLVNGDTHFEHYFRVKIVVFLKEIVTKKCLSALSAAKVAQGKFTDLKVMVNNLIQKDNTFVEQITTLQTQLEDYSQNTETIRDELAFTLLPWFPGSTVHLATAHFDILGSFVHVCVGGIQSQNSAISTIQNIIRQSGKFDSTRIVSAQEIKCRHTKTLTLCHISIDKLAVGRAQLVEYYMNLHEKVHTLLLVVTYWAHCSDLVGSDGLSTYSLCLLVIFYLQQEPYILPAVADLKNNLQENTHHEISTLENVTILELVNGFFKFYETFDYLHFVVTPYCGYPVEKSGFCKPYNVPSCFSYYVKHKKDLSVEVTMCIQDPFDHCRNVVQGASAVCGGNFATKCRNSITYTSDESVLLYNILNQPEYRLLSIDKVDNCGVDEWVSSTDNVTSEVLTKIFAFNIVKDWKPKLHQISYNCVIKGDVWKGRMNAMKTLIPKFSSGLSEMKKEIAVSLQTLKRNKTQIFERSVVVDLHFKIDPHRVEIFIRGFEAPCRKMYMEQFLRVKLRKFVEEYLRDQTGNSNVLEEPLTFDDDSRDFSYTSPPKSDENLPSKAINLTEDNPTQGTLKKDVKTKEKHRLVKPKTADKENPICSSRSRSPKPRRERFRTNSKESSRSRSRSYSKNQDNEKVKAKTSNNNQRRSTSDSEHSRCSSRSRKHSKTRPKEQSRSRSRSRPYGQNKDIENIRTKKPQWNRRTSTSSDSQHSRSPTRRRERSKKHPKRLRSRSRSQSYGSNQDKENIEANKSKRNQRTSSSDLQHSRSTSRSREHFKSRRTERSRSRSRSSPYGQNKDRENVRTKKLKWNARRGTSSDSQHSLSSSRRRERFKRHPKRLRSRSRSRSYESNTYKRSPHRRRRRSKSSSDDQSRSRSRSFRRNGDKDNVKTEKPTSNQRRSSTNDTQSRSPNKRSRSRDKENVKAKKSKRNQSRSKSDSEHSSSPCGTKERTKRWCRDAQKELVKQRKSFLEEVREKLKEVSQPVMSSVPFPYDLPVFQVPPKSPTSVALSLPLALQGVLPPPTIFASHFPDLHAPQHAQYANLSVVTIIDPLPKMSNEMKISRSEDMVTTYRTEDEVKDQVLEPKDKIMLQCLKTLRAMIIQTPRRPRVRPSKKPIYKPPGQSPLQNPQTQFKFTSPPQDSKVASFEETLLYILHAVDICSDPNDIPQLTRLVAELWDPNGTIDKNTAAKILQISLLGAMKERRSKERVEVGTQCYVRTKSVEVQVGVDILVHKMVRRDPRIYRYPMLLRAKEGNKPRDAYGVLDQVKRKAGYEE